MVEQNPKVSEGANPEIPKVLERKEGEAFEAPAKTEDQKPVEPTPAALNPSVASPSVAPPTPVAHKSETLEKIEDIMEEDLEEVYSHLPAEKKQEFRKKGEETAEEIEGMLFRVKINSKKVFKLLFGWMKIIPGVNKYFLKQEAKIKTDEILEIKEDLDRAKGNEIDL